MLYGQNILSVCHFENICECISPSLSCLLLYNSQLEKDLVFQRCTVSSADWAVLTCSQRWVQSVSCLTHFCVYVETVSCWITSADVLLNVCSRQNYKFIFLNFSARTTGYSLWCQHRADQSLLSDYFLKFTLSKSRLLKHICMLYCTKMWYPGIFQR